MEDTRKRKLAIIGFIVFVAVFFTGFIYAVVFSSKEKSDWKNYQQHVADSKAEQMVKQPPRIDAPIVLPRNEVVRVGRIQLIYRGIEDGRIQIAVVIPALDPKAQYLHSVDADRARGKLRLGGEYFRVISSRDARLKLERLKP